MKTERGQVLLEVLWSAVVLGIFLMLFRLINSELEEGQRIWQGFYQGREVLILKD